MSKRRGIRGIRLTLSATLDWCKSTAGRYWRREGAIGPSDRHACQIGDVEIARVNNVRHPFQVDFAGERMELKKFINVLNIGDRIRVLCDDGVLVAEKISHTQFRLVQLQFMSKFLH